MRTCQQRTVVKINTWIENKKLTFKLFACSFDVVSCKLFDLGNEYFFMGRPGRLKKINKNFKNMFKH